MTISCFKGNIISSVIILSHRDVTLFAMSRNPKLEQDNYAFIRKLLAEYYSDLSYDSIMPVSGGDNSNGYIIGKGEEKYFLKLAIKNPKKVPKSTPEAELRFLEYAHDHGVLTTKPMKNAQGNLIATTTHEGQIYDISMMPYINGKSVDSYTSKVSNFPELAPDIATHIGHMHQIQQEFPFNMEGVGTVNHLKTTTDRFLTLFGFPLESSVSQLLQDLQNPDSAASVHLKDLTVKLQNIGDRQDSQNADTLYQVAHHIENGMVQNILQHLSTLEHKRPARQQLPRGVCHGDCHPGNILQQNGRVAAIIDSGEMVENAYASDIANLMMNAYEIPKADADYTRFDKTTAANIIEVYHKVRPLSANEMEAIPDFMAEYQLTQLSYNLENLFQRAGIHSEKTATPNQALGSAASVLRSYHQLQNLHEVQESLIFFDQKRNTNLPKNSNVTTAPNIIKYKDNMADKLALIGLLAGVALCLFQLPLVGIALLATSAVTSPTIRGYCENLITPVAQATHIPQIEKTSHLTALNQREKTPDFSHMPTPPYYQTQARGYSYVQNLKENSQQLSGMQK